MLAGIPSEELDWFEESFTDCMFLLSADCNWHT